ncbi:MAG: HK97-gp10 family putative phage morphogenesis protein [Gallionella sp.]|jgi:HK97 gp10 family phage protein
MADVISAKIEGLDSLLGKLENLTYQTKKKGGRSALRKAAAYIRDIAKSNASRIDDPTTAEDISRNIVERWSGKLNKRTGNLGFRIGVLGGARDYSASGEIKTGKSASLNPGGDTFYWRFIEFGREGVAARPFMRPALSEHTNDATDVFVQAYEKVIDRAIKTAKKKGTVI